MQVFACWHFKLAFPISNMQQTFLALCCRPLWNKINGLICYTILETAKSMWLISCLSQSQSTLAQMLNDSSSLLLLRRRPNSNYFHPESFKHGRAWTSSVALVLGTRWQLYGRTVCLLLLNASSDRPEIGMRWLSPSSILLLDARLKQWAPCWDVWGVFLCIFFLSSFAPLLRPWKAVQLPRHSVSAAVSRGPRLKTPKGPPGKVARPYLSGLMSKMLQSAGNLLQSGTWSLLLQRAAQKKKEKKEGGRGRQKEKREREKWKGGKMIFSCW